MSSLMNDRTPEEQDPRNQATIAFLRKAYVTDEAQVNSAKSHDLQETEQALVRVRERLLTAQQERNLHLLSSETTFNSAGHIIGKRPATKKKSLVRRSALATLVAMLAVVFASSFFLLHQARISQDGSMVAQEASNSDPSKQAHTLVKQFHEEAQQWGRSHLYLDNGTNKTYMLDYAYLDSGLGQELDKQLAAAKSDADFKAVIDNANNALFHLQMFEAAATDKVPYDAIHQSDLQLLKHYKLQQGTVIIVSTAEQVLRLYRDGKLLKAVLVTTGKQATPSLIGRWKIEDRQSTETFTSVYPRGAPGWSTDISIQYAQSYHTGGYSIYGAWWRERYGPGTQLPHQEASNANNSAGIGNPNDGSTGGIEMSPTDAQALYDQTNTGTPVLIY